jgi:LysR family transcriptional regulator, transcriptional activator of nhaA
MSSLNYKHLRYFWMVARTGSIARAADQLHVTAQSISGQLTDFAESLGVELFRRSGRNLELTDTGRRILGYADTIFNSGDELMEAIRDEAVRTTRFMVGCSDSVSKAIACRLVAPALSLPEPVRLVCREGRLSSLLGELAVHRLDLIITDRQMPTHLSVRGYNHLLGESALSVFGAPGLIATLKGKGAARLNHAPMLLPGEDFAIRARLLQWLESQQLRPRIVGEFDDSAMMKAFGQTGAGLFFAPDVLSDHICSQYQVRKLITVPTLVEQVYAITTERRLSHPATIAISQAARESLFA